MAGDKDDGTVASSNGGGGRKDDKAPNFSLQFVNISMNAASQEERQRNQRVVRSAAMKSFRQKQKSQRLQEKAGSSRGNDSVSSEDKETSAPSSDIDQRKKHPQASSPVPSEVSSSEGFSSEGHLQTRNTSPALVSFDIDSGIEEALQVETLSDQIQPRSLRENQSIARLGGGRRDPFQIYPPHIAGSHVSELIDHCEFLNATGH